jgi:hypothetical protein
MVRCVTDWRESVQGVAGLGSIQYGEIRYCCGSYNGKLFRRDNYGQESTDCACVLGWEVRCDSGCGCSCGCVVVKRGGAKVPTKNRQAKEYYEHQGYLNLTAALRQQDAIWRTTGRMSLYESGIRERKLMCTITMHCSLPHRLDWGSIYDPLHVTYHYVERYQSSRSYMNQSHAVLYAAAPLTALTLATMAFLNGISDLYNIASVK